MVQLSPKSFHCKKVKKRGISFVSEFQNGLIAGLHQKMHPVHFLNEL